MFCSKGEAMTEAHRQGQEVGGGLLRDAQGAAKGANLGDIPQFKTASPPEAGLNASALDSNTGTILRQHEGGQFVLESQQKRPQFKLDPEKDELFIRADQAIANPQRTLEVTVKPDPSAEREAFTTVTCEEEGEPYPQACIVRIQPEIRLRYERVFIHQRHWGWGRHPHNGNRIGHFNVYHSHPNATDVQDDAWSEGVNGHYHHRRNEYRYQKRFEGTNEDGSISLSEPTDISPQEYQEYLEETQTPAGQVPPTQIVQPEAEHSSSCLVLEDLVEKGVCHYGEKVCAESYQTRVVHGVPMTRNCWAYRQTYQCIEPIQSNTCQGLRAKGCVQISSTCKTRQHEVCLVYQQTYFCPKGKKGLPKLISPGGKSPFCFTGNCADTAYEANGEMFEAMSHLAVLKEAQNDIKKSVTVFKGEDRRCTRNCVNFRDCCGYGKGWGMSLGLARCSAEERDLGLKRSQRKCVMVGTYCAKKVLGQCLEKKTTYCCFGTKLARLIQEAGHQQLGLSWGSPQSPQCQGLSPEQLSRLDFSKVDFSELFQDIADQFKPKSQTELNQSVSKERLAENMARLVALKKKDGGEKASLSAAQGRRPPL
jgi:type-F conjugative transfer system mating-pair stabilization protein TraN